MWYWSASNTEKTTVGEDAATESAGVSGVMPLTPDSTLVIRVVCPEANSVR